MNDIRLCGICGKHFTAHSYQQKYCSDGCKYNAQLIHSRVNDKVRRERKKAERNRPKKKTMAEIEREAYLAGMSYGQYVAKMGL